MKRAPLTLYGAIVSCLVGAAIQPAAADDSQATTVHGQLSAQYDTHKQAHPPTDVPRGDLRGDIVNNARGRPDVRRGGADERPQGKSKPGSR
ncbi:MAG TPA: hypothetical protein VNZ04_08895 [Trinickia sp.]|jgi:hypothetical protein|nr:hypothetical protein [Trinickia sp.]